MRESGGHDEYGSCVVEAWMGRSDDVCHGGACRGGGIWYNMRCMYVVLAHKYMYVVYACTSYVWDVQHAYNHNIISVYAYVRYFIIMSVSNMRFGGIVSIYENTA